MERRPTAAVIDTGALRHNYAQLKSRVPENVRIMAVVKANAYGHGDVEVARVLESMGCVWFGVAIPEEGERLRAAGIKGPVVVLGGVYPGQIKDVFDLDLTPVVFDSSTARLINDYAKKHGLTKNVHVKVDTGMGRLGLLDYQIEPFFRAIKDLSAIRVEALLSHFSEAEDADSDFTGTQLKAFVQVVDAVRGLGFDPEFIGMANSAAAVDCAEAHLGLIRPGIMLYGAYPSGHLMEKIGLKPVMQLKTRILHTKHVPAGFFVSYGRRFATTRESIIATLPIGYGDGVPRRLSGSGEVLVRGARAPMAGVVCMDLTMCDVTDVPDVTAGDEVVVMGEQGGERITAEEIARKAGTISYEIFCNISARVPRVYV
ncbi:MAG: alanine racemase [Deltaproteobacteria bacterium]|nr:alanine racemase [Deltaproteobacteria bacterium]